MFEIHEHNGKATSIDLTGFPVNPEPDQTEELMKVVTGAVGAGRIVASKVRSYWVIGMLDIGPEGFSRLWGGVDGQRTRDLGKAITEATGLATIRREVKR